MQRESTFFFLHALAVMIQCKLRILETIKKQTCKSNLFHKSKENLLNKSSNQRQTHNQNQHGPTLSLKYISFHEVSRKSRPSKWLHHLHVLVLMHFIDLLLHLCPVDSLPRNNLRLTSRLHRLRPQKPTLHVRESRSSNFLHHRIHDRPTRP